MYSENFLGTVNPILSAVCVAVPTVAALVRTIVLQLNLHKLMSRINCSL
jgi:hypothetical protein